MPIFFNLESHLWIAYLFFANGLLLTWLIRSYSEAFRELTQPFEAQCLAAFLLSITVNAALLLLLDLFALHFSDALIVLIATSVLLVASLSLRLNLSKERGVFSVDYNLHRLALYLFTFIILFYNGGLIDQLTDAWWHMSLANKIGLASSYSPEFGHLTGAPVRSYPPLWHGNLALASVLSDASIPVLWNSFTAWGGALKVMSFYLFAFGLTRDNYTAFLAALLFMLLPGIGNSYMRVSAWPSHIAYTTLYGLFYVFLVFVDKLPQRDPSTLWRGVKNTLKIAVDLKLELISMLVLATIIYFTHRTELLWFAVACFCYLTVSSLLRGFNRQEEFIHYRDNYYLALVYRVGLLGLLLLSIWMYFQRGLPLPLLNDVSLAFALPVLAFSLLLLIEYKKLPVVCIALLIVAVLASINYTHFVSLFKPDLALQRGQFHESPLAVAGYFGQALNLPSWHLQLRSGLIYSGIFAVPLSLILVFLKPSKATLFISMSAVMALLFCVSPYLYHWLKEVLGYHSPWRIMILNFHPVVIALCVVELLRNWRKSV